MPVLALFVVFAIVAGLLNHLVFRTNLSPLRRAGYRSEVPPPAGDVEHRFDPAASWSIRGGVRIGRSNATAPFAELEADRNCVVVRSVLGAVAIDRADVTDVRGIGRLGRGIPFDSRDGRYDGVIFWTMQDRTVLDVLHQLGWPVSSAPQTFPSAAAPAVPAGWSPAPSLPGQLPPPPVAPPARTWAAGPSGAVTPGRSGVLPSPNLLKARRIARVVAALALPVIAALLVATFVPPFPAAPALSSAAALAIPFVILLFGAALVTSLPFGRLNRRPYRSVPWARGNSLPVTGWRKSLVTVAVVVAMLCFASRFTDPNSAPQRHGDRYTVERHGVVTTTDEAGYDRAEQANARGFLAVELAFFSVSFALLSEPVEDPTAEPSRSEHPFLSS